MYFELPIIGILKVVWLLIEWEIHEGGVLHHSSPLPLKGSDIPPWRPTASLLLSLHNLVAPVTAQLIHESLRSSYPITSFGRQFWYTCYIVVLHKKMSPFSHFLASSKVKHEKQSNKQYSIKINNSSSLCHYLQFHSHEYVKPHFKVQCNIIQEEWSDPAYWACVRGYHRPNIGTKPDSSIVLQSCCTREAQTH